MISKSLFVAVLEDDTTFTGGDYYNTKWTLLPKDKKIKRLFYTLPDGNHLCLDLYNKYYHFIEGTNDLNGRHSGKVNLEYVYLLGQKDNKIICYKINLQNRPNKNLGDIERIEYNINDSFIKSLNPVGWR
jgi:hypothetical protein